MKAMKLSEALKVLAKEHIRNLEYIHFPTEKEANEFAQALSRSMEGAFTIKKERSHAPWGGYRYDIVLKGDVLCQ